MPTTVFYAGQKDYIPKLNDLWDRATVSVIGTSTTSLSISTGSKSFITETNLQFAVGSQVTMTATVDLSKYMSGQVTSYNQSTGAITVNVTSIVGSGTFTSWSITLSGAAGATGADGIADSISIGTVTSGTAAASITGTSPNKFLNLTLQSGAAGAPNVLSIGTVNTGTAAANITGTSPSQVLNLTLPTAPPNTLTIGTVTSGTAAATITGTSPNQVLNLTLQQGAAGAKGVNPRGNWNAGTAYIVDDLAYYAGSTWRRIIAGTTATAPSSDATNWEIFAQKGADGAGSVAGVTASAPLASTGGANPDISITQANTSTNGYLSSADWNTFNGKAPLISPSFTTPTLGVATATTINKVTFTTPATGSTLTIADGKTFTSSNTLTISGTDGSTLNVGTGGTLGTAAYTASTAYAPTAGSVSVTTLGTVTTGIWNAGVVAGQYGGTGVNNSGKTITLGGNLTTSGAFASTFTMTATTAVTFPTSGTLATLTDITPTNFTGVLPVAKGGTGLATLTSGSVVVGNGTSTPTLVAPSTSGNVLTSNGTTWISSPAAGGGGGAIVLLGQTTQSAVSQIDVEGFFTTTYDRYIIMYTAIKPSTDAQDIYIQLKISGVYPTSSYDGHLMQPVSSGSAYSGSVAPGSAIKVANAVSNAAAEVGATINLELSLPADTGTRKQVFWTGASADGGGATSVRVANGVGKYQTAGALTGVRIKAASGNISATVRVYGIQNA